MILIDVSIPSLRETDNFEIDETMTYSSIPSSTN